MQAVATKTQRRFTVTEYEQMIAVGVIREGERVELLGGEIVAMAAMGLRHATCLVNTGDLVYAHKTPDLRVGVQVPILLDDESQPEPDLVVYRRHKRMTHPTPAIILLVIEIADTSLSYDRNEKLPRYAAAGIPEAWLFDTDSEILERHTEPFAGQYRQIVTAGRGESLPSTTLSGLVLAVDDILAADDGN